MKNVSRISLCLLAATVAVMLFLPSTAEAQPYGAWLTLPSSHAYMRVPHSPSLNFTTGFTFEAWVSVRDNNGTSGCSSIAGKGYVDTWWVGVCGTNFRSYIKGISSAITNGTVPANDWTHVAVTFDGTTHRQYIDGELVGSAVNAGPMPTNSREVRIGSDVDWEYTPGGAIDEVRLWNVARTQQQIRDSINRTLTTGTGLVARYGFDAGTTDSAGTNNGTTVGSTGFLTFPAGPGCSPSATQHCFLNRFGVTVEYTTSTGTRGQGRVVTGAGASTPNSGLFWFFNADNWELLVKALDGCSLNNRKWIYAAGTTDVHYEMTVFDYQGFQQKKYFNYQGQPAPAITDSGAFATCP